MRGMPRGSRGQRAVKQTARRYMRANPSSANNLGCIALIVLAVVFIYFMAK